MTRFYMHIGMPRCASTTIETAFLRPDYAPHGKLTAAGVRPIRELHDALRTAVTEPTWDDEFLIRVRQQCIDPFLNEDCSAYFSSDEGLTLTYSEEGLKPDLAHRAQSWAKLMVGLDPVIILIVRNQPAYIESLYGLHLQNAGTSEFPNFVNSLPMGAMDWAAVVRTWSQVFGEDKIIVLPMEKSAYDHPDQPCDNFLDALQRIMGVESPVAADQISVFNPSLPKVLMPVQQQINEAIDKESAMRVAEIIRTSLTPNAVANASLLGADHAQTVRALFKASNEHLFYHFMPNFNPVDYLPS